MINVERSLRTAKTGLYNLIAKIERVEQRYVVLKNRVQKIELPIAATGRTKANSESRAAAILTLRAEHPNWTQQQIADALGLSQPLVRYYLSPNCKAAFRIQDALARSKLSA